MTITTNCPGCNAPLQIEENTTSAVCQFCGAHFEVDTSQTSPTFRKAGQPGEPQPEPNPPAVESSLPEPEPASFVYNPPLSGETQAPHSNELYNPPILPAGGPESPVVEPPPPFYTPPAVQQPKFLSGARLWIIVGVVILAAFCMTCLCLALFTFRTGQ